MVIRYKFSGLYNPEPFGNSGHQTFRATYRPEPQIIHVDNDSDSDDDSDIGTSGQSSHEQPQGINVIYKANKHGRPKASVYEVAFSEIARLHMMPDITPVQTLCEDDNKNIVGVCSENISYALERRHPKEQLYSLALNGNKYECKEPDENNRLHKTPFHFLNEMPNGFFDELLAAHNTSKHYRIDMETLASSLVGKYVLEEDDLHKGNLGIYTRKLEGKNVVHFFNIDHDLLMSGSITSFFDHRGPNFAYGVTDYQITPRDLLNFPDLKDSKNHYWPTQKRHMVLPGDKKIYDHGKEREAFAKLKYNKEFQRYKWKYLLKSAIIPPELTDLALQKHLDIKKPGQNQHRMLISQALAERQSQLRAVLFSLKEFRMYLKTNDGQNDFADIKEQLMRYGEDKVSYLDRILESLHDTFKERCKNVEDTDTPLHVALRMQDYRFEQTLMLYGSDINTPNKLHPPQWPVDIVASQIEGYLQRTPESRNPSLDPVLVLQHLLKNGARLTIDAERMVTKNGFTIQGNKIGTKSPNKGDPFVPHAFSYYLGTIIQSYDQLLTTIGTIGQDPLLSLKTKKKLTIDLVRSKGKHLTQDQLDTFKTALNGNGQNPIDARLKFLHQLRSTLWIIRWLRGGLYGKTSSVNKLNRMLTLGPSVHHQPLPWPALHDSPNRQSRTVSCGSDSDDDNKPGESQYNPMHTDDDYSSPECNSL
ncbi:cardiac ankyrin repeat-containing protein [Legionella geestiana]|uniref:Cardiac ankyrin repeat-containing protein n=1 Tax=Legionella geestiana TaxID=45065 RepID=A0A0W0U6Z8_9GAMM|nr:Dot/Icm T4SS effector AnkK/LegA5 [Legionella geestiana]KTD03812.1 cardiac ankyrin repeat-containing protein [Legionella geestiana]QBS11904.1 hypothetical protein E4T54_03610 [Legionella geestiana]STX53386.1 ankyrin [Legionella geestiana]